MKIKKRIAKFMYEKFNSLNWGCPNCGGRIKRWSWHKAYCTNKKCNKTFNVTGL